MFSGEQQSCCVGSGLGGEDRVTIRAGSVCVFGRAWEPTRGWVRSVNLQVRVIGSRTSDWTGLRCMSSSPQGVDPVGQKRCACAGWGRGQLAFSFAGLVRSAKSQTHEEQVAFRY